eukprot:14668051-Alexandrium_andersonii.AAC.1
MFYHGYHDYKYSGSWCHPYVVSMATTAGVVLSVGVTTVAVISASHVINVVRLCQHDQCQHS